MTRLLCLILACAVLTGCGRDRRTQDSAARTEPSATEAGVTVSGYARVGISKRF